MRRKNTYYYSFVLVVAVGHEGQPHVPEGAGGPLQHPQDRQGDPVPDPLPGRNLQQRQQAQGDCLRHGRVPQQDQPDQGPGDLQTVRGRDRPAFAFVNVPHAFPSFATVGWIMATDPIGAGQTLEDGSRRQTIFEKTLIFLAPSFAIGHPGIRFSRDF